jgi:hypothetical protein
MSSRSALQRLTRPGIPNITGVAFRTVRIPQKGGYMPHTNSTEKTRLLRRKPAQICRAASDSTPGDTWRGLRPQQLYNATWIFWNTVDVLSSLGAVGAGIAFVMTQEALLIGGPIVLPLVALYASRRREAALLEVQTP